MHRPRLSPVLVAIAMSVQLLAASGRADELPPQDSPSYTAVYKAVTREKVEPSDEKWLVDKEETVTIAVSGARSRWDYKSEGRTAINDYDAKTIVNLGGTIEAGKAIRTRYRLRPIRWELGYAPVARATGSQPEVLGNDTIAGRPCTRLRYKSDQFGEPEYCVTKDGIVLRFKNRSDTAEAVFEAVSITPGAPDPKLFEVPANLEISDQVV